MLWFLLLTAMPWAVWQALLAQGVTWVQWQAGFLLKGMLDIQTTLMILGGLVVIAASFVLMIRFSVEHKEKEQRLFEQAVHDRSIAEAQN